MNILYLEIGQNQAYFMCLSNSITPQPIAPESCSSPQKTWQIFESAMKYKFLVRGFNFLWMTS